MVTTIWKFPLCYGEVTVQMPEHSKILHIGMDPASEFLAVWALVNPAVESVERSFAVIGTGHPVPDNGIHIGSVVSDPFVWHIFETTEGVLMQAMLRTFV